MPIRTFPVQAPQNVQRLIDLENKLGKALTKTERLQRDLNLEQYKNTNE